MSNEIDNQLFEECNNRNLKAVKDLIKNNDANVNAKNNYGETPLHIATRRGSLKIVEFLIKSGSNINEKDNDGKTPLSYAFPSNIDYDIHCPGQPSHGTYLQLIRYLLENGATYST